MTHIRNALVEVGHQVARVTPDDVRALLGGDLAYSETEFLPGGPLGHQMRRKGRLLHRSCQGGFLVPAGLASRVADRLRQAGCQVTVRNLRRFGHKTTPHLEALAALVGKWQDQDFMRAVAGQPRGLIEARGAAEQTRKVALVCRLFPLANVLVAWNAGRRKLSVLRSRLQRAAPAQVFRVVDDYAWPYEGGRLVCSQQQFGMHNGIDFDVAIFLDALQTLSPSRVEGLGRLTFQRVYGFTSPHTPMSDRILLRLHSNIGPYVWHPPDPHGTEAKVRVEWGKPPWSPAPGRTDALERKRTAYFRNDRRNDHVANVARALADGDDKALWECGLMFGREGDHKASVLGSWPAQVILVESTEHGRELLRRLPDWELIDAASLGKIPHDIWKPRLLHRAVVTYSAAIRMPRIDADVLIHAGGEWTPALYGSHRPHGEVVLVDLADDFDAVSKLLQRTADTRNLRLAWDYLARGDGQAPGIDGLRFHDLEDEEVWVWSGCSTGPS